MTEIPILGKGLVPGDRLPIVVQLAALGVASAAASAAVMVNPLLVLAVGAGIALIVLSIRWPLLALFVFVALIPIEDSLNVEGVGTLSRLVGILFAGIYAIPRLGRLVPGALPLAGWAYVAWAILSVAWAVDATSAGQAVQTLIQMAVIGFLVADVVIHDPTTVRPILWVYSASATATAGLGIVSYLVGGSAPDARLAALAGQNPAQFASLLLPAFLFGLNELLHRRRIAASGLVAGLCMAGIVLSGTRSVWVAAVVVVLVLLLPRFGFRRAAVALGVVCVLVVITFQIPGVPQLVADRSDTAISTGGAGRTDIWAVGLQIFESSPVVGVGYGNFIDAFTGTMIRLAGASFALNPIAPHNVVLGSAAELGLVGVALLALFIVPLAVRRGWGPDALIVQAILAALLIDALFIDIFGYRKQVWIAIGLASGLAYLANEVRRRDVLAGQPAPGTELQPDIARTALPASEPPSAAVPAPPAARRRPREPRLDGETLA